MADHKEINLPQSASYSNLPEYKNHVNQILASYDSPEGVLGDMTLEGLTSLLREFGDPAARVTPTERARVAALLSKQVQKDNDLPGLLFEKFEAHRKLMRYEQRAFNQLRKRELGKKVTKPSQSVWPAINIVIAFHFRIYRYTLLRIIYIMLNYIP